jgi:hypothetical protein
MQLTTNITMKITNTTNDSFIVTDSEAETPSGTDWQVASQAITTASWQAIALGPVGTAGVVTLKNNDSANYVTVALDNAGTNKVAKLDPTKGRRTLVVPLDSSATLYAKANTATCQLSVLISPN